MGMKSRALRMDVEEALRQPETPLEEMFGRS